MEAMVDVEVTKTEAGDAGEGEIKQAPVLKSIPPVIDVDALEFVPPVIDVDATFGPFFHGPLTKE